MNQIKFYNIITITVILIYSIIGCKQKKATPVSNYVGKDSIQFKEDNLKRIALMHIYDKYTFDLYQEEDSLLIIYKPIINQESPMVQATYYASRSAYMKSIKKMDSAVYYAKKGITAGLKDTTTAFKPVVVLLNRITALYSDLHQNDSAIKYGYLGLNLAKKYNYKLNETYSQMTVLYSNIGDIINLKRVILLSYNDSDNLYKPAVYNNMASLYFEQNQIDSAFYFINMAINGLIKNNDSVRLGIAYAGYAAFYNKINKLDSAKYFITIANKINKRFNNEDAEDYQLSAKLYLDEHNTAKAIIDYKKMLQLAIRDSSVNQIIDAYQKLARTYMYNNDYKDAAQIYDSGYASLITLKNNDYIKKTNELESDYRIKNKQQEVDKLNIEKENTRKTVFLQRIILIVILLLLSIIIFSGYLINKRRKLKIAKQQIESEKEIIELEQRLLRSQMNPHFIFNAIAGIRGTIMNDEKEKAVFYLTKFSKLLRQILENSAQSHVSLTEEIQTIENYMILQQMRYNNKFTYQIHTQDNLEIDEIEIPSLLIQPFIENSIEHGFKGIPYPGKIDIYISKIDKNILQILIQDNGVGVKETKEYDGLSDLKNKSMSLEIIQMQLAIISKNLGIPSHYTIKKDTETQGVKVILQIGIKE